MFSMEISCIPSHLPKHLPRHKDEGAAAGRVTALCSRKMSPLGSLSCSCIRKCDLPKNLSCCNFVEYTLKTFSNFNFEKTQLLNYKCKNMRLSVAVREPLEDEPKKEGEAPVCDHNKSLKGNGKTTIVIKGVEQVLHMVGGNGETSYSKNSSGQSEGIMKAKPIIEEAVKDVFKTLAPKKFVAVDLGCSSGPNTFLVISEIANTIDKLSRQLDIDSPEIQMFLNDLPRNDFNNIFQSLDDYEKERVEKCVPLYVVGSPGSFYTRLFPSQSVHFFHSSYSQMWLSKVPAGVEGQSKAQLKNKILYMEQFKEDFSTFLKLRSKELISGGRMVLTISGRRESPKHKDLPYLWGLLSMALNDMISEGLLEERERNATNFPIHSPSMEEIKSIIQIEGSFYLDRLKAFELSWDLFEESTNNIVSDYAIRGKFVASYIRALVEPLLDCHFDKTTINELFSRFAEIVAVHLKEKPKFVSFILDMKLKG